MLQSGQLDGEMALLKHNIARFLLVHIQINSEGEVYKFVMNQGRWTSHELNRFLLLFNLTRQ